MLSTILVTYDKVDIPWSAAGGTTTVLRPATALQMSLPHSHSRAPGNMYDPLSFGSLSAVMYLWRLV